jgi:hypothetical protein
MFWKDYNVKLNVYYNVKKCSDVNLKISIWRIELSSNEMYGVYYEISR